MIPWQKFFFFKHLRVFCKRSQKSLSKVIFSSLRGVEGRICLVFARNEWLESTKNHKLYNKSTALVGISKKKKKFFERLLNCKKKRH